MEPLIKMADLDQRGMEDVNHKSQHPAYITHRTTTIPTQRICICNITFKDLDILKKLTLNARLPH